MIIVAMSHNHPADIGQIGQVWCDLSRVGRDVAKGHATEWHMRPEGIGEYGPISYSDQKAAHPDKGHLDVAQALGNSRRHPGIKGEMTQRATAHTG